MQNASYPVVAEVFKLWKSGFKLCVLFQPLTGNLTDCASARRSVLGTLIRRMPLMSF